MTSESQVEVVEQNPTISKTEERHLKLTEVQKAKINQTMKFIEGACLQWDQVKAKGHKIEMFLEIFAGTLAEYDQMLSTHKMEPDRAKFLLMVKIRESLVDLALSDNEKMQS